MFTLIYTNGKEAPYTGGQYRSLNKMQKYIIAFAEKNPNIMAVRYNNRDNKIVWERENKDEY